MVQFQSAAREILVKIVYYGPGLSGKTTNLVRLHELIRHRTHSELVSVETMEDRTLFFDLLPVQLPLDGRTLKFQVYTVPGQVHYDSTRRIILAGADGVVFVADSDSSKRKENVESLNNLHKNLNANRLNIKTIPLVFQYNKRDLDGVIPVPELERQLNFRNVPSLPAVALRGEGVVDTFTAIARDTATHILQSYQLVRNPVELERARSEIEQYLQDLTEQPMTLAADDFPSVDSAELETGVRQEPGRTRISRIGADGPVSEDEMLDAALATSQETAAALAEVSRLKAQLEEQNRKLQEAVRENQVIRSFLESLFHHAGLPIFTIQLNGRIGNWNRFSQQQFGYTAEEAGQLFFSDLIPEDALLDVQTLLSLVKERKRPTEGSVSLRNKSGMTASCRLALSPIFDEKQQLTAICAIVTSCSF